LWLDDVILRADKVDNNRLKAARREAVELCRDFEFNRAKLVFAEYLEAPDEELVAWARAKQEAIDLAQQTFSLVREGEDVLVGERFAVKSMPQRVAITAIGVDGISAEYREKTYDKGKYIGDKVVKVTIQFSEIRPSQFVKLAEIAGRKRGTDEARLNLMLGAYLLSRADDARATRHYLTTTTLTQEAAPMLAELEEMD
jgi:hypothetical protein